MLRSRPAPPPPRYTELDTSSWTEMRTMASNRQASRVALLVAGGALLVGAGILSELSGCVFDAKQGYGDYAKAQRYDSIASVFLFASVGCFAVGVILGSSRRDMLQVALATAGVVAVVVISLYFFSASSVRAALQCTERSGR